MKKPMKGKKSALKMGKPGKSAPNGSELSFGKFGAGKVTDKGAKK